MISRYLGRDSTRTEGGQHRLKLVIRYLVSFALLAGAAGLGRGLVWLTGWPVPSSLVGLLVLFVLMLSGVIKLDWVEPGAAVLLAVMAVFFVPPAVGLVEHIETIKAQWAPMLLGTIVATLVVLVVVGVLEQRRK